MRFRIVTRASAALILVLVAMVVAACMPLDPSPDVIDSSYSHGGTYDAPSSSVGGGGSGSGGAL